MGGVLSQTSVFLPHMGGLLMIKSVNTVVNIANFLGYSIMNVKKSCTMFTI